MGKQRETPDATKTEEQPLRDSSGPDGDKKGNDQKYAAAHPLRSMPTETRRQAMERARNLMKRGYLQKVTAVEENFVEPS